MVGKVKAAVDTRVDPDFMIIARTDARTVFGIDEAIERGLAYREAGADIIFIESPETPDEMRRINREIPGYTLANMVEGGRTPLLPNRELEEIGYNIAIYPTASIYVVTKAVLGLMEALKKDGTTRNVMSDMVSFTEFNELIGLAEIREKEVRYANRPQE